MRVKTPLAQDNQVHEKIFSISCHIFNLPVTKYIADHSMDQKLEKIFLDGLEQNKQKLLRICSVYAMDKEDTKDLFQEVLTHIWQSLGSFKDNSLLAPGCSGLLSMFASVSVRMELRNKKDSQIWMALP